MDVTKQQYKLIKNAYEVLNIIKTNRSAQECGTPIKPSKQNNQTN